MPERVTVPENWFSGTQPDALHDSTVRGHLCSKAGFRHSQRSSAMPVGPQSLRLGPRQSLLPHTTYKLHAHSPAGCRL